MLTPSQQAFIAREIFSLVVAATFQHNPTYSKNNSPEPARVDFRADLRQRLEVLAIRYKQVVPDCEHLENIVALSDGLSEAHKHILEGGRFRIGSTQKALNLFIKYQWCMGQAKIPPHCPIDAIILERIPGCENVRWTKLDSLKTYIEIINKARVQAGGMSLAEWELQVFNKTIADRTGSPTGTLPPPTSTTLL